MGSESHPKGSAGAGPPEGGDRWSERARQQITIQVRADANKEGDETFNVNLSSPTNATIVDATGVATIVNDD